MPESWLDFIYAIRDFVANEVDDPEDEEEEERDV